MGRSKGGGWGNPRAPFRKLLHFEDVEQECQGAVALALLDLGCRGILPASELVV